MANNDHPFIGPGKYYEPPFALNEKGDAIIDRSQNILMFINDIWCYEKETIAKTLIKLLNDEFYEETSD